MVDWKKEIKLSDLLGGSKKTSAPADAGVPAPAEAAPEAAETTEKTSIWKKELSFGRKQQRPKAEKPAKKPKREKPSGGTPLWKKEISFGRKPKEAEPEPEPELEPVEEPEAAPAAIELVEAYVAPVAPAPAEPEPELPTAEAHDVGVHLHHSEAEVAAEPVEGSSPGVPIELFATPEPEPDPVEQAEIVDLPIVAEVPAPEPEPEPVPEPAEPLPPAAAAPPPVVVHPPVPADRLPALPDEKHKEQKPRKRARKEKPEGGERVPFYRRELSFGRRKQEDETTEAAKPPREKRQKHEKREKPERAKRERRQLSIPRPSVGASRSTGKMPKRLVGLKIGASQLAAASVENSGDAEVLHLARERLAPGIVAGGELREPDALAEALREFFRKHKLPRRGVRLGIATNRIGVRTLEITGIDDAKQLANAIKFRAQEALPIPIDEAVLDYHVLSETTNDVGETTRRILLVLAYRDLIDRYVSACRKAGITLVGIDLEAFALLRALAEPREESVQANAALVAVTVGHDRTTFAVSDGRVCEFTRVLDWGGASLNVAIARALDVAPSEVEDVKHGLSLAGTEVPEGLTAEQAQNARDALRRQVQSFARELVSSLQFYQNQPGSLGIGEIVLTGGTAHLAGFVDELQRLIGVRVRVGDPLVRVKLSRRLKEPEQVGSLAVAIGLGIED